MNHYIYLSSTNYDDPVNASWKKDLITAINDNAEFRKNHVVTFLDPLAFFSMEPPVVNADVQNMDLADAVVFYIERLSIGTLFELAYCTMNSTPRRHLYLISKNDAVRNHPWIRNLTTDFGRFKTPFGRVELCDTIKDAADKITNDFSADALNNKTTNNTNTKRVLINEDK